MNETFKYLFLLILISYIISEIYCLSYNFKEGYSGFINKYELVSDPTKAGSIDIIDSRFNNQKQLTNLISRLIYNQYLEDPYKYKHIGSKLDLIQKKEQKEKRTKEKRTI